jgi:pimeloyl-ACP methyl ester carboxylesterase
LLQELPPATAVFEDGSHLTHLEEPDRFLSIVDDFLVRNDPNDQGDQP